MQIIPKRTSTPDLRKKAEIINLRYIDIGSCVFIGLIIGILILSALCVAAYPNSNIPAGI